MMLHFRDPSKLKTKKIVFEDIFAARDSGTLEQLKELSSKRRAIEESLNKSSSITDAIAREISGGLTSHSEQEIQKLEQYLPILENLVYQVGLVSNEHRPASWSSELKIRWSSALTLSSFFGLKGPKFFQMSNLHFELAMTLFLYGSMIRERAYEVVSSDLVQSATLLRKAAGIFHYLAYEIFSPSQPAFSAERPLEVLSRMASIMSLICLAEAQAITIRKAEDKGNTVALLSKLHYGVVQLLDDADVILCSAISDCKDDISARLVEFISSCKFLHELRTYKYLAEGIKSDGQTGAAIGIVRESLVNAQKNILGEESWQLIVKQEIKSMNELLRKYERENDFIMREKIPLRHELPSPEGKKIVSIVPYHPQKRERITLAFKI